MARIFALMTRPDFKLLSIGTALCLAGALLFAPLLHAQTIPQLPAGTTPTGTEPLAVYQGGKTVKVTTAQVATSPTITAALPAASTLTGSETIPGVQSGGAVKMTAGALASTYVPSVLALGVKCDGSTDDIIALQADVTAISAAGGGTLLIPATGHSCVISTTLAMAPNVTLEGQGNSGLPSGSYASAIAYTGTADAIKSTSAINSSTAVNDEVRDLKIRCTNGSNVGAGYDDVGGTSVRLSRVQIAACKYGVIFDQTELGDLDQVNLQNQITAGLWLVNDAEHTALANSYYTNRISVTRSNINEGSSALAVIDDGGAAHVFIANNLNGGSVGAAFAAVIGLKFTGNDVEAAASSEMTFSQTSHGGTTLQPGSGISIDANTIDPASGQSAIVATGPVGDMTVTANNFGATSVAEIVGGTNITTLFLGSNMYNGSTPSSGTWTNLYNFTGGSLTLSATSGVFGWPSTGVSEFNPGVVAIGNGTAGDLSGTLLLSHLRLAGPPTGTPTSYACFEADGGIISSATAC